MTTDTSHDDTIKYADGPTLQEELENYSDTEKVVYLIATLRDADVYSNNLVRCFERSESQRARAVARLAVADSANIKLHGELSDCYGTIRELEEQVAELREQVASRTIAIEERDRVVSEQRTLRANTYRTERDHYQRRAQQAEAERDTVKAKLHRVLTDLNGLKAANDEMGRKMEEDAARIASLEAEISTSEAEFSALKEAPDAVA